jgi:putative Mn2+ efflux pump MntP
LSAIDLGAISLALGLDAFGVALSLGLDKRINKIIALFFTFCAGFFQGFFVFAGGVAGEFFNRYICTLPHIVGGSIIILVGILMIREGFSDQEKIKKIHWLLIVILGISVSIDALVIGFSTFNVFYNKVILLEKSLVVSTITSIMTILAFFISRRIRIIHFFRKYADFIGGIILILFGIKMILF